MADLVCIRTFPTRATAEVARAVLEEGGIVADISAEDTGYDVTFSSGGAKLKVSEEQAEAARELLENAAEGDDLADLEHTAGGEVESKRSPALTTGQLLTLLIIAIFVMWLFAWLSG